MNSSVFPALASQVSISVAGVGSYLPDHRVSNQEILEYLRPARPDGRLLEPEWVVKHLGIHERRLDYEFGGRRKRSRADGGIYDGDLALAAARSALGDAGIGAEDVDIFVHVTSTPDLISCQDHFRFLMTGLGLRRDADLVHHNLGLRRARRRLSHGRASLISMVPATALVVASNCPSGYFGPEVHDCLLQAPERHGMAGPAHVRRRRRRRCLPLRPPRPRRPPEGLLSVRYETNPDVELVTYPAGGCLHHTSAANLSDHVFLMDGVKVAEVFPTLMARNFQMLQEDWPTIVKPLTGTDFDIGSVARWYLHQANGVVVRQAVQMLGLPPERVPIGVDHYGNTSAASTLILLDEDRRAGRVRDGDLVAFLWIGAGNGAMNGYAAMML